VRSSDAPLTEVGRMLDAGNICIVTARAHPLAVAHRAQGRPALEHIRGKIALTVPDCQMSLGATVTNNALC